MSPSGVLVCSRAVNVRCKKCETEACELSVSWHTLSNLFYILRRDRGAEKTIEFLRHLLSISSVAPVGQADALRAVEFGLNDFEDALQLSAAESCRADLILTRNKADFGNPANIAVLTPEEFAPPPALIWITSCLDDDGIRQAETRHGAYSDRGGWRCRRLDHDKQPFRYRYHDLRGNTVR
jgi:hypothetical protein